MMPSVARVRSTLSRAGVLLVAAATLLSRAGSDDSSQAARLVELLELRPGAMVADIGAGRGEMCESRAYAALWEDERHARPSTDADLEHIRHRGELPLVREARLEEGLGLGRASNLRGRLLWRVRDLPVPGRPGGPWQRGREDD